jgi:hypothetical protein
MLRAPFALCLPLMNRDSSLWSLLVLLARPRPHLVPLVDFWRRNTFRRSKAHLIANLPVLQSLAIDPAQNLPWTGEEGEDVLAQPLPRHPQPWVSNS